MESNLSCAYFSDGLVQPVTRYGFGSFVIALGPSFSVDVGDAPSLFLSQEIWIYFRFFPKKVALKFTFDLRVLKCQFQL